MCVCVCYIVSLLLFPDCLHIQLLLVWSVYQFDSHMVLMHSVVTTTHIDREDTTTWEERKCLTKQDNEKKTNENRKFTQIQRIFLSFLLVFGQANTHLIAFEIVDGVEFSVGEPKRKKSVRRKRTQTTEKA